MWRMLQRRRRRKLRPPSPRTLRVQAKRAHLEAQPTGQTVVVTPMVRLLCHDIQCLTDADVAPDSLDLVLTDPPYHREALPLYAALGAFSARHLRPGGSLVVLCGQLYVDTIMALLGQHLSYKWLLAWYLPGNHSTKVWSRHVLSKWKPVLLYGKDPWTAGAYYADVFSVPPTGTRTRTAHHAWGQEPEGMRELVRRFATPGAVVCDPFAGGGAIALAVLEQGCSFLGIDIDQTHIETTRARIAAYIAGQPRPAA
jgi:16S rRNA G966 N2-methylase RsmD